MFSSLVPNFDRNLGVLIFFFVRPQLGRADRLRPRLLRRGGAAPPQRAPRADETGRRLLLRCA